MWLFYCGLANFELSEMKLRSLLCDNCLQQNSIYHYALESQQKCVCDAVMMYSSQKLEFEGPVRADLLPIEYLVTNTSKPIKELRFRSGDNINTLSLLHILMRADLSQLLHISISTTRFGFMINSSGCICLTDGGIQDFCEFLKKSINVKILHFEVHHTILSSARALADQINHCSKLFDLELHYQGTPECIQTFVISLNLHMSKCSLILEALDCQGHTPGPYYRPNSYIR